MSSRITNAADTTLFVTGRPSVTAMALALALISVLGCDYTCEQLKGETCNVHYYDVPKIAGAERDLFAGQVVGLEACALKASTFATLIADERQGDWSYVCCLKTDESGCVERHR